MVFTISLNGPDNVGKTTQLELLPAHFTISKVGGLHDSDEIMAELHRQGRLKEWWWGSTPVEFVSTIFGALARRHRNATAGKDATMAVFDRGIVMFEAVAVAVIAMKDEDEDLANARRILDGILDKYGLRLPPENMAVLMKHGRTLDESVRITMSRESDPDDERYRALAGAYQHTIHVTATNSIGGVQNHLRKIILEKTANPLFQPMMHHLVGIYAFGGLSECGKSTIAEAFCVKFGTKQAFRAKIAYFNNMSSEALRLSIYDLSEKEQALYLLHELDRFQRSHYWLRLLTIESLHRDSVTKYLKMWLGEKSQVVFIDTSDSQRRERSLVPLEQLISHDGLKLKRGAMDIRSYADLVLDNNGPLSKSNYLNTDVILGVQGLGTGAGGRVGTTYKKVGLEAEALMRQQGLVGPMGLDLAGNSFKI